MSDNKEPKQAWAPERIWLQRGVGDDGSHTWCSDSQDEHEEAEYVRIDVQTPAVEAGARDDDAAIAACALMIKGICLTRPQEDWVDDIKSRIRYMLAALARASEAAAGEPVAYVPVHPRTGPLWANTVPSLDSDRPAHYPVRALCYAAPQPAIEPKALTDRAMACFREALVERKWSVTAGEISEILQRARALLAAAKGDGHAD